MYKRLVLFAAAALVSGHALADMNYNYVQGSVIGSEIRGGGDSNSGNGFGLNGSAALGGTNLIFFFDVNRTKYTETGASIKFTPTDFGVGYHAPISDTVDFIGGVSYERFKLGASASGVGSGSTTEKGWGLGVGLRGMIGDKMQWDGGIKYRDVGDLQGILGISVGGRYYFTPAFAVGLELSANKYDKDVFGFSLKENKALLSARFEFQ